LKVNMRTILIFIRIGAAMEYLLRISEIKIKLVKGTL
jgi:hypothetical protein